MFDLSRRVTIKGAIILIALGLVIVALSFILAMESYGAAKRQSFWGTPSPTPTASVTPESSPTPSVHPTPLPTLPGELFTIKSLKGYEGKNKERVEKAIVIANKIVASDCFKEELLKSDMIQTDGLTNQQILDKIRASAWSFELVLYYQNNRVVGWTNPLPYRIINQNLKFFAGSDPVDVASNLVHEYSHKIGFDHDYNPTRRRPKSVPYTLNRVIEGKCGSSFRLKTSK